MEERIKKTLDKKMQELVVVAEKHFTSEEEIDFLLQLLREHGASQIQTMRVLILALGFSSSKADSLLLHSSTWSDKREQVDKFRENFWKEE